MASRLLRAWKEREAQGAARGRSRGSGRHRSWAWRMEKWVHARARSTGSTQMNLQGPGNKAGQFPQLETHVWGTWAELP